MSIIVDYLPWFLALLTVLVFVHEMGHYLAARAVGVHAEAFSVGFGPELFGWTDRRGCRWRVALVPLGGYVKMQGDADAASAGHTDAARRPGGLLSASIGARALIFAAGPFANFLLAGVVAAFLYASVGQSVTPPVVGAVAPEGAAAAAGLQPGDRILSIDGDSVERFEDVSDVELTSAERTLSFRIERSGETFTLEVAPESVALEDRFGNRYERGDLGLRAQMPPLIGTVDSAGAGAAGGMQPGDLVVALEGRRLFDFGEFAEEIRARPEQPTRLTVRRDGREIELTVTPARVVEQVAAGDGPAEEAEIGRIGVAAAPFEPVRLGPGEAAVEGAVFVWEKSGLILDYLWQIVAGVRPVNEIGGVLRIAQIAGDTAAVSFLALVSFGMMLSLNLGLINLFPVPMLDGGHLVFLAVEWARGRRLSERAEEIGYRFGFAMVIGLMLFATWNDLAHFQVYERLKTWIG